LSLGKKQKISLAFFVFMVNHQHWFFNKKLFMDSSSRLHFVVSTVQDDLQNIEDEPPSRRLTGAVTFIPGKRNFHSPVFSSFFSFSFLWPALL
jgi:hypothetical protein